MILVQVPLTHEDVLHPQEEDFIVQTDAHDCDCYYLKSALERKFAGRDDVEVLNDVRVDWQVEGIKPHGPDLSIFANVPKSWKRETGTLLVKTVGDQPMMVIEVTSPSTRLLRSGRKSDPVPQGRGAVLRHRGLSPRTGGSAGSSARLSRCRRRDTFASRSMSRDACGWSRLGSGWPPRAIASVVMMRRAIGFPTWSNWTASARGRDARREGRDARREGRERRRTGPAVRRRSGGSHGRTGSGAEAIARRFRRCAAVGRLTEASAGIDARRWRWLSRKRNPAFRLRLSTTPPSRRSALPPPLRRRRRRRTPAADSPAPPRAAAHSAR